MKQNDITDFDPMQEAIEYFVNDDKVLDTDKLQTTLEELGLGKLDKKELEILLEVLSGSKDSSIS